MIRLVYRNPERPARRAPERRSDELSELAQAAVQGDRSATHALLVALAPHLLRTVRSVFGRNDPDVEDVAQEAALVVLDRLHSFRGESSVVRFATQTAVLVAMNARRKRAAGKRGGGVQEPGADPEQVPGRVEGPEARLERAQIAAAARSLLLALPAAQAEALALHCMAGCTLAEIAVATGAPRETVKSRLRLARQALRHLIDGDPELLGLLEGGE